MEQGPVTFEAYLAQFVGIDWDPQPDPDGATDNLGRPWETSTIWEYGGDPDPPPF